MKQLFKKNLLLVGQPFLISSVRKDTLHYWLAYEIDSEVGLSMISIDKDALREKYAIKKDASSTVYQDYVCAPDLDIVKLFAEEYAKFRMLLGDDDTDVMEVREFFLRLLKMSLSKEVSIIDGHDVQQSREELTTEAAFVLQHYNELKQRGQLHIIKPQEFTPKEGSC